ncbi:MAG: 5'/3'-nucleotidase SurE [Spirochaetota bacterium]
MREQFRGFSEPLISTTDDDEIRSPGCVPRLAIHHAMNTIFHGRWPDLIVSGVNYGENLRMDITISGTVGAAFQAAAYGIPALAASQQVDIAHRYEYGEVDREGSTRVVRCYVERILDQLAALPSPAAPAGRDHPVHRGLHRAAGAIRRGPRDAGGSRDAGGPG